MQTIQFKIDDNYLDIVLTLLNNLKVNIKDLLIVKETKKDEILSKFTEIENSTKQTKKTYDFLKLGGSNCWDGDLKKMRENRINYDFSW